MLPTNLQYIGVLWHDAPHLVVGASSGASRIRPTLTFKPILSRSEPISIVRTNPPCNSPLMMTPVNTPHGGIGASIALRPAPQGRRSHPSAGMTAVTGGCPNQNFARHLDGQFLDSEVVMKKRMHLGCLGGQRRFGAAFAEFGCQITPPAVIFCHILNSGPFY